MKNDDNDEEEEAPPQEIAEPEEEIDVINPPDKISERAEWINLVGVHQKHYGSPIDIKMGQMKPMELPSLEWHDYSFRSKKVKLLNTGYTLIYSVKYHNTRPYIRGGPLRDDYIFSQLHFHWGRNDMEGSEHCIDGTFIFWTSISCEDIFLSFPLEMHVVHYKKEYESQENALTKLDGLCIVAYFYQIRTAGNVELQFILDTIPLLKKPRSSVRMSDDPVSNFIRPFYNDYFTYWGSVQSQGVTFPLLWIICREPIGINIQQTATFRTLLDINNEQLQKNFHPIQSTEERQVFHVNRCPNLYSTLLPVAAMESQPND